MSAAKLPADGFHRGADVQELLAVLNGGGERAMIVGGAVRDALLGRPAGDIDIATTAPPRAVMARAREAGWRAIPTGIAHGTVTVLVKHRPFEVTTLREDVATDGRHAEVRFGRDFAADARRRDFTVNALYADADGVIHDSVGGLRDLDAGRIRFIGDARARIREDYLRILRLFRFHSHYGVGPLDRDALEAAIAERAGLARLSRERVGAEMLKLLASRRAGEVVAEVAEAGFLTDLLGGVPDIRAFAAVARSQCDATARLAALAVRVPEDAERLSQRLRLSNAQGARLVAIGQALSALHGGLDRLQPRDIRALAWRFGADVLADALAIAGAREAIAQDKLAGLRVVATAPLPALPWTGARLVAAGIAPGPRLGAALARAEALWIVADFPTDPAAHDAILARALADIDA